MYDISEPRTFDSIPRLLNDAKENASKPIEDLNLVLIGNKSDKERKVPVFKAETYAKTNGM